MFTLDLYMGTFVGLLVCWFVGLLVCWFAGLFFFFLHDTLTTLL